MDPVKTNIVNQNNKFRVDSDKMNIVDLKQSLRHLTQKHWKIMKGVKM